MANAARARRLPVAPDKNGTAGRRADLIYLMVRIIQSIKLMLRLMTTTRACLNYLIGMIPFIAVDPD